MKKTLVTLVCLGFVLTIPGVASANTLVIPFFADGGSLIGTGEAKQGQAAFIGLKSLETETITVAIRYTDNNGIDCTPTANSFQLGPGSSKTFRPVRNDPNAENTDVPNAVQVPGSTMVLVDGADADTIIDGGGAGGAEITSTGMLAGNLNTIYMILGIQSTHAYNADMFD